MRLINIFEHQLAASRSIESEDDRSKGPKHAAKTPRDSRLHMAAINDTSAQR